jgi:2-dehydro-3-deoxygluconokinase
VFRRIVENVDVLVGNEEDIQRALDIPGPEAGTTSELDADTFVRMIEQVVAAFPRVTVVATTLREVVSANRHRWSAVAWVDGRTLVTPTLDLDVLDRIGGGDGFAAGFFYGLLVGENPEDALGIGWAHGALLATFPGDTTMATLEQVRALARGDTARVKR